MTSHYSYMYLFVCLSVYLESKYCPLLESEGGLSLLEPLAETNNSRFQQIPKLAQQILRQCRKFRLSADSQSTDDLDDLSASVDVNNVDMTDDDSDNNDMVDDSDDDIGLDYWPGLYLYRPNLTLLTRFVCTGTLYVLT